MESEGLHLQSVSVPRFPQESKGTTNNLLPVPRGSPASLGVLGGSKGIMDVDVFCKSQLVAQMSGTNRVASNALSLSPSALQK